MTINIKNIVAFIGVSVLLGFVLSYAPSVFAGLSSPSSTECRVTTVANAIIGDDISSNILATSSARAWARLTLVQDTAGVATSTAFLSFNQGAPAAINTGVTLSTTTPSIDFGINTDFPYAGMVTGIIRGTASTTVQVTQCVY